MQNLLILEQPRMPENALFAVLGKPMGLYVRSVDPGDVRMDGCQPLFANRDITDNYDAVVVRSYRRFAVVRQVAKAFQSAGKPVFGLAPFHPSFTQDKLCDLMDLQAAGVAVPRTWARAEDTPKAVVVAKENWGYGGSGVELQDMVDTSLRAVPALAWVNHHFQEYLEADEDWRVLVCEGRALPWIIVRRPRAGDFRTNTHQGGELEIVNVEEFPLGRALCSLAVRAAEALGRQCAGVDLRRGSDGQPVVLEVNRTPRLRLGEHTEVVMQAYLIAWAQGLQEMRPAR